MGRRALLFLLVFLLPFLYVLWTEQASRTSRRTRTPSGWSRGQIAGNTEAVAWSLYRDYLLPFEVASVFLLVAMIGAVVLGKRSLEKMD